MALVLDASVALAWFVTETPESKSYADRVADELSMSGSLALVPISFNLECAIVLRRERNRRNLSETELEGALATLDRLPIEMHDFRHSVRDILRLAASTNFTLLTSCT